MNPEPDAAADRLTRIFEAKARAEIRLADAMAAGSATVAGAGDPTGEVLVVKGEPGPADMTSRRALAGADGDALRLALEALGFEGDAVWSMCSRPRPGVAPADRARRLEATVEAVDPRLVVALDAEAAQDLASAFGARALRPGVPAVERGRVFGAVGGLEASLGDDRAKARVWAQMKALAKG